jgi:hypothetical protein
MRRQDPRVSPNSTRERGPIDATILASLLASERTTTQLRDTDLTHRPDRRAAVDGDDTDFVAGGFETAAGGFDTGAAVSGVDIVRGSTCGRTIGGLVGVDGFDVVSVARTSGVTVSRIAPAALEIADCRGGAFVGAAGPGAGAGADTTRDAAESAAATESAAALAAATLRARGVSGGELSCRSHAVPTTAMTPAAATPLQI